MIQGAGGVVHHLREYVIQHIIQIQIVEIKGAPVHLRPLAQFRHRHPAEGFFRHQFQQRSPDGLTGVASAAVQLPYFFRLSHRIFPQVIITFPHLFRNGTQWKN